MAYDTDAAPEAADETAEDIHKLAMERFLEAENYDRDNREAMVDDLAFVAGPGHWTSEDRELRKGRPCLTINQFPQFIGQVVGDMRQNAPAIRILPAEDGDKEVAEVRSGLVRAIENRCDAQGAYVAAADHQVGCGQGNLRVLLDWVDDGSFDQDIMIKAVPNPLAVLWDPMSVDRTGADAEYVFLVDDMPRKVFQRRFKDKAEASFAHGDIPDGVGLSSWTTRDTIRIAEYWFIKRTPVKLLRMPDGNVRDITDVDPALLEEVPPENIRLASKKSACRYLISGTEVLEGPYELPIDRVPIVRVVGRITDTGTTRYREGIVRQAKDPARLRNYWRSTAAEMLALQPKASFLADERAVDGREDDFRDAAKSGDVLLIKNTGGELVRLDPPAFPAAVHQEAQINVDDIKAVTGIYDSSLGARSNETSGKAILARERQGDVATYVFHDNLQASVKAVGHIVNSLIPLVYDTPRTIRILGEDMAPTVKRVNDPTDPNAIDLLRGKYDVVVSTGPSYSTKRVEAAESMMQFVQAAPQVMAIAGDLVAAAQDWPMAEEFAKRLKATLPPGIAQDEEGEQPNPMQQQAMMAQQQQAQAGQAKMQAEIAKAQAEAREAVAEAAKAELEVMMMQMQLQGAMPPVAPQFAPGMVPQEQGAF